MRTYKLCITWTGLVTETPVATVAYRKRRQYFTDVNRMTKIEIWVERGVHMNKNRQARLNAAALWFVRNHEICNPGQLIYVDPAETERRKSKESDNDSDG